MKETFVFKGLHELIRKLEVLPRATQKSIVKKSLDASLDGLKAHIKHQAPRRRSGRLALRLRKTKPKKRTGDYIGSMLLQTFGEPFQNQPPSKNAFYSIAVQYGHKIAGTNRKTRPNKFMERGAKAALPQVTSTIKDELIRRVTAEMKKS